MPTVNVKVDLTLCLMQVSPQPHPPTNVCMYHALIIYNTFCDFPSTSPLSPPSSVSLPYPTPTPTPTPAFINLHQLSWMMEQETLSVDTGANDILKSNVMCVCAHVVPFKVLSILQ